MTQSNSALAATRLTVRKLLGQSHVLGLVLLITWTLVPLIWSLLSSLKNRFEVYETPPALFPAVPMFSNYMDVLRYQNFAIFVYNSVFVTVSSTVLTIVLSILAAYGFARYKFFLGSLLFVFVLIPRIIPQSSLIVPLYRSAVLVGLLNTYTAMVLSFTAVAVPLSVWILTGFFRAIPNDLEDAARIDGARPIQIVRYIIVPIAFPAIITVAVFAVRQGWNQLPLVLALTTRTTMRTLPYQLFALQDQIGVVNWPVILAFTWVTILPILGVYLVFQRKVVRGIISGAIK